jgi:hypothetical protein
LVIGGSFWGRLKASTRSGTAAWGVVDAGSADVDLHPARRDDVFEPVEEGVRVDGDPSLEFQLGHRHARRTDEAVHTVAGPVPVV